NELAVGRRPTRDERLAWFDAVDPALVANLAVERHCLAVTHAEGAGETRPLRHRRGRAEDHVEPGRDEAAVHRTWRPLVHVAVRDERDRVVTLAHHGQRWRDRMRVAEEGVALPHLRLGVHATAQALGRLVAASGTIVGEGG